MARKASVETNKNRLRLQRRLAAKRQELKDIIMKKDDSDEAFKARMTAVMALAKMPRNSAKVRYRLRCQITGRPRGNYRQFGICRIKFRNLASFGELPGITKSSW